MKTLIPKMDAIESQWYLINAEGLVLGRLASHIERLLMGKGKPVYVPHELVGDYVVIINGAKIHVTGRKAKQKFYQAYSGYPGGRKVERFDAFLKRKPAEVIRQTVRGMLPKNRLGVKMLSRLFVYSDTSHPHQAQQPVDITARIVQVKASHP